MHDTSIKNNVASDCPVVLLNKMLVVVCCFCCFNFYMAYLQYVSLSPSLLALSHVHALLQRDYYTVRNVSCNVSVVSVISVTREE